MVFYNLPAFTKGDDTAFLSALARANKLIKKSGELDLDQASRIVLRDWSTDKFPRYTMPPPPASASKPVSDKQTEDEASQSLYAADGATLEAAPTRKELRKGLGLVKLVPLEAEARKVALEENWDDEESDGDVEMKEGDGAEDGEAEEGESGSEDEDEEDEDEEEEEAPPTSSSKTQATS